MMKYRLAKKITDEYWSIASHAGPSWDYCGDILFSRYSREMVDKALRRMNQPTIVWYKGEDNER